MLIALGQLSPAVGDLAGNEDRMRRAVADARAAGAAIVLFPELALSGYTAGDLLLREDFLEECGARAHAVAGAATGIVAAFGAPMLGDHDLHNSLVVAADGRIQAVYDKVELPNYGVFDEARWFGSGDTAPLIAVGDQLLGLTVCADLWISDGPATVAARAGARLILNASASTFHVGKAAERDAMLRQRATDLICPIAYCNLWGSDDELLFDGGSVVVDHRGQVLARAGQFHDELLLCEVDLPAVRVARLRDPRLRKPRPPAPDRATPLAQLDAPRATCQAPAPRRAPVRLAEEELWDALVMGIAARAAQSGLSRAAVALEGDVGSAVVAALAVDALGADRVTGVVVECGDALPPTSARDAAGALGCLLQPVDLAAAGREYSDALAAAGGADAAAAGARWTHGRAAALDDLAEARRWLLLTGTDKSALACGVGPLEGALAPVGDLWRSDLRRLAQWRRERGTLPFDDDETAAWRAAGLPGTEVADPILRAYVEGDDQPADIVAGGYDDAVVLQLVSRVESAELRRRRAAAPLKVSVRGFGRDRRVPVHHAFPLQAQAAPSATT